MSEHDEQVALFDWARAMESRHPQLALMFAIPNGGLRNKRVAEKLKREGVRAGVLDIFLAIPRLFLSGSCPGLFIEMKYGKNPTTPGQKKWIAALEAEGYQCEVCYSFEEAKAVIVGYLGLETN